jgi:hypothetical protein
MEEVKAYKSSDGKLHTSKEEAIKHEIWQIDRQAEYNIEQFIISELKYTIGVVDEDFEVDEYTSIEEQLKKFLIQYMKEVKNIYNEVDKARNEATKAKSYLQNKF